MIDNPEPPSRRSRLEDEVLEILYRSDRPPSTPERIRSALRRTSSRLRFRRPGLFSDIVSRFDSGLWLLVCVALGVVAFAVRNASPLLARALVVLCLALFVLALVRSFGRPNQGSVRQWRGRDINISPSSRPLWLDRVFRGQRRPPRR